MPKNQIENLVNKPRPSIMFSNEDGDLSFTIMRSAHKDMFIVLEEEPYTIEPECNIRNASEIQELFGEKVFDELHKLK